MLTVELNLRVTKVKFIRWLRHYVASTREEKFPTLHGAISVHKVTALRPGELWPSATIDGIETITDEAWMTMPKWSRLLAEVLYCNNQREITGLINLRLKQNGRRLHVKMACVDSVFDTYFVALIAAIRTEWPKKKPMGLAAPSASSPPNPGVVSESPAQQRLGGRQANADDEWAWCEVRLKGRSPKEVYAEWRRRIGARAGLLADAQDSFRKAIKPARLAEKYGKPGESSGNSPGK